MASRIHATALVHKSAELGDEVEVGPYCIVEQDVRIGDHTVLRPNAVIRRYTSMGEGNYVDSFTVLGGEPQDYKFNPRQETYLHIGDGNIFREGVTISRATTPGQATRVGDRTYWFAHSHAGHDCTILDNVVLVNGALVAGHCTIGRGAILPAHGAIHQFCWIGEKVMFQGGAAASMHVPPYVVCADVNNVVSLNTVGLRRSEDLTNEDRQQIKDAFSLLYLSHLTLEKALEKMDLCTEWGAAAGRFRDFVRRVLEAKPPHRRGLCPHLSRIRSRRGESD
jgi:UDP-N-acetylglucosamine acyltransferase